VNSKLDHKKNKKIKIKIKNKKIKKIKIFNLEKLPKVKGFVFFPGIAEFMCLLGIFVTKFPKSIS
jgi:hypothetical protein